MAGDTTTNDAELHASMNDFEAALTAKRVGLKPPRLDTILVLIDGSNQSDMALGLARELVGRCPGAIVHVGFAYPGATDAAYEDLLAERVASLAAQNIEARQVTRQQPDAPSYTQDHRHGGAARRRFVDRSRAVHG